MAVGKVFVGVEVIMVMENASTGEIERVKDFYWFEENNFHNNGDNEWFIKSVEANQI